MKASLLGIACMVLLSLQGCIQPLTMDGDAGRTPGGPVDFVLGLADIQVTEDDFATKVDEMTVSSTLRMDDSIHVIMTSVPMDDVVVDSLGNPLTKGALVTSIAGFKVFGYQYASWSASCKPNIGVLQNVDMSAASGYYWPSNSNHLRFFAVSDGSSNGLNCVSTTMTSSTAGMPYFTYSPTTAGEDLLVADSGDKTSGTVSMAFSHIMSALDFVVTGFPSQITISNIYINANVSSNLKTGGTYTFGSGWSSLTSGQLNSTFNVSCPANSSTTVTSSSNKFFIPPQSIAANSVYVTVRLTSTDSSNNDGYMECYLPAMTFVAGRRYTFYISSGSLSQTLSVSDGSDFTASTATVESKNVGTVYSYLATSGKFTGVSVLSARIPVPWTVEYSEDGSSWSTTRPSWLSACTTSGTGGSSAQNISATRTAKSVEWIQSSSFPLSSAHDDGGVYNLAYIDPLTNGNYSETRQYSSNCYIVHGPGWYSLPLVYGPTLYDSGVWTGCYDYFTMPGSRNYVNAYGREISHWNIYTDIVTNANTGGATAALGNPSFVWMSKKNLITNISYMTTPGSAHQSGSETIGGTEVYQLKFYVPAEFAEEGNAVIGILKPGSTTEFIWTWHIWIMSPGQLNFGTYSGNRFLNYAIGELSPHAKGYAKRVCWIRVKAGGRTSSAIKVLDDRYETQTYSSLNQIAGPMEKSSILVYEWGRKDLFPYGSAGSMYWNPNLSPNHNGSGWPSAYAVSQSYGQTISRPYKYSMAGTYNQAWNDYSDWPNLWCRYTSNGSWYYDSTITGKTIYDPCPMWMCVPNLNFGTNFSVSNWFRNCVGSQSAAMVALDGGGYSWWTALWDGTNSAMMYWTNYCQNYTAWPMDCVYVSDGRSLPKNTTSGTTDAMIRPQYWD